jgi:IclR family acetate operon transcriptional repressor
VPTKHVAAKKAQPAPSRPPDQYFSRAVSKALQTLELLNTQQAPMSLHDIARGIQLSKTSTLRLLRTLETAGYLVPSGMGRYSLAPGTQSIVSTQFLARLMRVATPLMEELTRELRETVSLAALFDNRAEVIAVVESPQTLRMSNVVGHILPPNASSLGKAICAFQSVERRERLLRSYGVYRFTEHSITDRNQLEREFGQVRSQGFAVDREESVNDGNCFGVPILAEGGEATAAISMSIPKVRVRDSAHEAQVAEKLTEVARQIAAELYCLGRTSRV